MVLAEALKAGRAELSEIVSASEGKLLPFEGGGCPVLSNCHPVLSSTLWVVVPNWRLRVCLCWWLVLDTQQQQKLSYVSFERRLYWLPSSWFGIANSGKNVYFPALLNWAAVLLFGLPWGKRSSWGREVERLKEPWDRPLSAWSGMDSQCWVGTACSNWGRVHPWAEEMWYRVAAVSAGY